MALVLTEEQELLQETAREFVQENAPVAKLRELRDTADPNGFSRELWQEMVQLGWAGILFPEDLGGAELGFAELGVVLEECGRQLVASPLFASSVLGGSAILLGGRDDQKKELLPAVAEGEKLLALAYREAGRYDPGAVSTRAEADGDGYRLSGEKAFVLDGHVADSLIVSARTAGDPGDRDGITLFLVDREAAGVDVTRTILIDSRNAARVRLGGVRVDRSAVLGEVGSGADILEPVLDRGAIAISAEMLGSLQEAFERTVDYLKTRKQFGVPIGSFQALKHRAAFMFCEVELAKSIVMDALRAIDEGRADVPRIASVCKARCSDAFVLIANEAIQMFAGIGMTDEEEIGFFLKRARVTATTCGDAAWHRDRYARLEGY